MHRSNAARTLHGSSERDFHGSNENLEKDDSPSEASRRSFSSPRATDDTLDGTGSSDSVQDVGEEGPHAVPVVAHAPEPVIRIMTERGRWKVGHLRGDQLDMVTFDVPASVEELPPWSIDFLGVCLGASDQEPDHVPRDSLWVEEVGRRRQEDMWDLDGRLTKQSDIEQCQGDGSLMDVSDGDSDVDCVPQAPLSSGDSLPEIQRQPMADAIVDGDLILSQSVTSGGFSPKVEHVSGPEQVSSGVSIPGGVSDGVYILEDVSDGMSVVCDASDGDSILVIDDNGEDASSSSSRSNQKGAPAYSNWRALSVSDWGTLLMASWKTL